MRSGADRVLLCFIEGAVVVLALGSVWPFGSIHAFFEWLLFVVVSLLLLAWGARVVVNRQVIWISCPVTFLLAVLCVLSIFQIVPLPTEWVDTLSPNTNLLRQRLMPRVAEFGAQAPNQFWTTLSLDPGATRIEILRLIAILGIFASVRSNLRDPGSFYRLSWLLAGNGVMLALVGMGQLASSPHHVVFWTMPTEGEVFGPFINRNHAAYYLNLCLGLTFGLLLGTRFFLASDRTTLRGFLRDPRILWLICGLGIMLAGLLSTLSRGGVISFLVAGLSCLALLLFRSRQRVPWIATCVIVVMAGLLISWQGTGNIGKRFEDAGEALSRSDSRIDIWKRSLRIIAEYPVFGTGRGTFFRIDSMWTRPGDIFTVAAGYAHNDFLELWVEGGIVQLVVALAIVLIVFQRNYRAFRIHGNTGIGRLALGAFLGFSAIIVHSFVDFGMHVPAVAVLTTVVGAMLMNLTEFPEDEAKAEASPSAWLQMPGSWVLQAASLIALAWYLGLSGWYYQQAERYRLASKLAPLDKRIEYLQAAISYVPDRIDLYPHLADGYLVRHSASYRAHRFREVASIVANGADSRYPNILAMAAETFVSPSQSDLEKANEVLIEACRKTPIDFQVQTRLETISTMGMGSPFHGQRLERLVVLAPNQPDTWLRSGLFALSQGDKPRAFRAFRNCLVADKKMLPVLLNSVPTKVSEQEFLREILSGNPRLIFESAKVLAERTSGFDSEAEYYRTALKELADRGDKLSGEDLMLKGRLHIALDQNDLARRAFDDAIAENPRKTAWRFELSQLLFETGNYQDARRQLLLIQSETAQHRDAEILYKKVIAAISEKQ